MLNSDDVIYYGDQTRLAITNFGAGHTHEALIKAYAEVKKAALMAVQSVDNRFKNVELNSIIEAIDEIIAGKHNKQFPLNLSQGGAGTSLNMNVCEVIANRATKILSENGENRRFDPIEDINRYQSTNDTFPTAITIVLFRHLLIVEKKVIDLQEALVAAERKYSTDLMLARTEMQDALPITLGQMFGGWAGMIERDRWRLHKLKERIRTIALGGTAIGTGFNAPQAYVFAAEKNLRSITGLPLTRSQNLIDEISNMDKWSELAAGYKILADNFYRIAADMLLLTSSTFGEIKHPNLQYGSSIMAAKTNPVALEMVLGLSIDIAGEADKIHEYVKNGRLQLNAFAPFVLKSFFRIFTQLEKVFIAFIEKFLEGMEPQTERMAQNLYSSPAILNCLVPYLGYLKTKELYNKFESKNIQSKEDFKNWLKLNSELTTDTIDQLLDVNSLTSFIRPNLNK